MASSISLFRRTPENSAAFDAFQCGICLENDPNIKGGIATHGNTRHLNHYDCFIETIMRINPRCPECRVVIVPPEVPLVEAKETVSEWASWIIPASVTVWGQLTGKKHLALMTQVNQLIVATVDLARLQKRKQESERLLVKINRMLLKRNEWQLSQEVTRVWETYFQTMRTRTLRSIKQLDDRHSEIFFRHGVQFFLGMGLPILLNQRD